MGHNAVLALPRDGGNGSQTDRQEVDLGSSDRERAGKAKAERMVLVSDITTNEDPNDRALWDSICTDLNSSRPRGMFLTSTSPIVANYDALIAQIEAHEAERPKAPPFIVYQPWMDELPRHEGPLCSRLEGLPVVNSFAEGMARYVLPSVWELAKQGIANELTQ
jgi:hypothetical protein